jgi:type IV pilus assembly protein PilP
VFIIFSFPACGLRRQDLAATKIEKKIKEPVALSTTKLDKTSEEIALKPDPPTADKTMLYNPEGKIDPFAPLFKEEKPVVGDGEAMGMGKAGICIPHTPLQKADLSQLKLVGIICASSGNRAMVEEASGRGYVIKKGTFIGINCGRVGQILKDSGKRVINIDGKQFKAKITKINGRAYYIDPQELKLQKPSGE